MKTRSDAWTPEQDILLAETVLRHIREGGTQLNAFEEVGDAFNRTSAAVGFRWNAEVRYRYDEQIAQAKRYRKELKRAIATKTKSTSNGRYVKNDSLKATLRVDKTKKVNFSLTDIISHLQGMDVELSKSSLLEMELQESRQQVQSLKSENENLKKQLESISKDYATIQEDYQVLTQIMNRARRMVLLEEEENTSPNHSFRMDKNGNLEKIAN